MLAGGRTCVDMEDYGCACEAWLREFMTLENGIPSHDTFSRVFQLLAPSGLQKTLLGLAQNWADRLGGVVAVDGKVLRQSFEKASERSPTHLLLTVRVGGEADLGADRGGRQVERDSGAAGTAGADRREGADACTRNAARRRRSWPGTATTRWRSSATRGPCTRTWRRIWTVRPNRRNSCRINRLGRAPAD